MDKSPTPGKRRQKREEDKRGLVAKLAAELRRKLKLMSECENKEDRDIIGQEIFNDVTGELDSAAQRKLEAAPGTCFYQVLAYHYSTSQEDASELLILCRSLWANKVIAAVYCLVLHRWTLDSGAMLASEDRLRHLHVLTRAAQALFQGDMAGGKQKFRPVLQFLYEDVVLSPLALHAVPEEGQDLLLTLCINHLPYYIRDTREFPTLLKTFAHAAGDRATSSLLAGGSGVSTPIGHRSRAGSPQPPSERPPSVLASPQPMHRVSSHQSIQSGTSSGLISVGTLEGVDYALLELCRYLKEVKSEVALLKYLECFDALRGTSVFVQASDLTRLRLQSELFDLTVPGGPRYTPYKVRRKAGHTLDALYPSGKLVRRLTRFWFRIIHPGDVMHTAYRIWRKCIATCLRAVWTLFDMVSKFKSLPARMILRPSSFLPTSLSTLFFRTSSSTPAVHSKPSSPTPSSSSWFASLGMRRKSLSDNQPRQSPHDKSPASSSAMPSVVSRSRFSSRVVSACMRLPREVVSTLTRLVWGGRSTAESTAPAR